MWLYVYKWLSRVNRFTEEHVFCDYWTHIFWHFAYRSKYIKLCRYSTLVSLRVPKVLQYITSFVPLGKCSRWRNTAYKILQFCTNENTSKKGKTNNYCRYFCHIVYLTFTECPCWGSLVLWRDFLQTTSNCEQNKTRNQWKLH